MVASWCGARQVLDAWAGRPRWWRLSVEGVVIGIACMLLVTRPLRDGSDYAAAARDAIVLCGGLGLLLTCANVPLARRLRPGAASTAGVGHDAPGLAPDAG